MESDAKGKGDARAAGAMEVDAAAVQQPAGEHEVLTVSDTDSD
jgi:hypothetical protein